MLDRKKLLAEQLDMSKKKQRKARPVPQSKATGSAYNIELRKLVRSIRADINEKLIPLLKATQNEYQADAAIVTHDAYLERIVTVFRQLLDRWQSPQFRAIAERLARNFVTTADQVNRKRFDGTMQSIGINVYADAPSLPEFLSASIYDNTQLITSIPSQYLERVQSLVMSNVRAGNRSSAIVEQLSKQFGVTDRRAKMIARDQTAKVNGQLVKKRQTGAGFPYFQWLTSDDERVRDRHDELAERVTQYGKGIYSWDNPPMSDDGRPIIPGEDYQCRCNARPVSQREVDENKKAGRTRPGVKR